MKSTFDGTDYAELATHWGVEIDECVLLEKYIRESMYTTYVGDYSSQRMLDSSVKGAMVEYLQEFVLQHEKYHYGTEIFLGLLMLADEDDEMFVTYFCDLLPHMWC